MFVFLQVERGGSHQGVKNQKGSSRSQRATVKACSVFPMSKELNHSQNGSSTEDKADGCDGAHPESQPSEGEEGGLL